MTITARPQFRKNATYNKVTIEGKPPIAQAREIARAYDVSGTSMTAINTQVEAIKKYLDATLTVAKQYPKIAGDLTVTEWNETGWTVEW